MNVFLAPYGSEYYYAYIFVAELLTKSAEPEVPPGIPPPLRLIAYGMPPSSLVEPPWWFLTADLFTTLK